MNWTLVAQIFAGISIVFSAGITCWSIRRNIHHSNRRIAHIQKLHLVESVGNTLRPVSRYLTCLSGSRVMCDPPVMNTDLDIFVWVPEANKGEVTMALFEQGWEASPSDRTYAENKDKMVSWRRRFCNLILVHDGDFFNNCMRATELCTTLNLKNKRDRIAVFRAMRA